MKGVESWGTGVGSEGASAGAGTTHDHEELRNTYVAAIALTFLLYYRNGVCAENSHGSHYGQDRDHGGGGVGAFSLAAKLPNDRACELG